MYDATENINIVNRTAKDISMVRLEINEVYRAGPGGAEEALERHDLADIFKVTFLVDYNLDGSNRMLIDFA